jgi:hypothetical protein
MIDGGSMRGWHKFGIVASLCWFIVGPLWIGGFGLKEMGVDPCFDARSIFDARPFPFPVDDQCMRIAAILTFTPIPIIWLIAYGMVRLARRIRLDLR